MKRALGVRGGRRGFTLIELAIAMSVLMIGMVSAAAATMKMHHLRKQNRERVVAQNALRSMAERVHAQSHRLSADPKTWSEELIEIYGEDGTFGAAFDVPFLNRVDQAVPPGTLSIVTDETARDQDLGVELGLPRDLNGDGDASDTDVTDGAVLLPIVLRLSWRGQHGVQTMTHGFYAMGY